MWVLPKNYKQSSAFAADMVESKEDLSLLESDIESSLMWRSKPMSLQTWSRKWNQVSWLPHLFGRTLKPSRHTYFEEQLTLSLAAILASRLAKQEVEKEQTTPDTYGPSSDNILKPSDQNELFSRMSKDTYRLDCPQSSATWKKMVTEQRGDYSARKKLAHRIAESECLSWPTPTATNNGPGLDRENRRGIQQGNALATAVAWKNLGWWATPNTMDYLPQRSKEATYKMATTTRKGRSKPSNLREQVNPEAMEIYKAVNWPTPVARDWSTAKTTEYLKTQGRNPMTNSLPDAVHHIHINSLQDQSKNSSTGSTAGLNPDWVESLMGIPTGWTDLGSWGTE